MQVDAVMTRQVVKVAPQATLAAAQQLMRRGRFRHLPVVEDGRLLGVVSERDVRPPAGVSLDLAQTLNDRHVQSVMRAPVITVAPRDSIEDAAQLLFENKIGCLPVLHGEELVGIVTTGDIFRAFVQGIGLLEPGTRVELRAGDLTHTLRGIAHVAAEEHAPITGLITERDLVTGERRVIVRFATLQGPHLTAALRARGLEVAAPEVETEG